MRRLILFLGLVILGSTACSKTSQVPIPKSVRADLALLPQETNVVFFCDFSKASETPIGKDLVQRLTDELSTDHHNDELAEFKRATGLDPLKDFHSVLLGTRIDEKDHRRRIAIIRGNFDAAKLTSYIQSEAKKRGKMMTVQTDTVGTHTVYVFSEMPEMGLCFVDAKTIYFGPKDWLISTLGAPTKASKPGVSSEIATLLEQVTYGDHCWLTAASPLPGEHGRFFARELRGTLPIADKVQTVAFSAHLADDIQFSSEIQCKSTEDSKAMVDLMKGAIAAAKLSVSNERAAVDVLNRIKVSQEGNNAYLHGELTKTFFDLAAKNKIVL